ncbi:MAG: hypothetical protein HN757_16890 [Calditrichaeota bacterium]|jgi:hypothetical protein|nr:hypothetical protein [Calditrichota bacterium]
MDIAKLLLLFVFSVNLIVGIIFLISREAGWFKNKVFKEIIKLLILLNGFFCQIIALIFLLEGGMINTEKVITLFLISGVGMVLIVLSSRIGSK